MAEKFLEEACKLYPDAFLTNLHDIIIKHANMCLTLFGNYFGMRFQHLPALETPGTGQYFPLQSNISVRVIR